MLHKLIATLRKRGAHGRTFPVQATEATQAAEIIAGVVAQRDALLEALRWYEAQAKDMGKAAIHSDSKTMLALMHEVAVDYGKRARAAIAKAEGVQK